MSILRILRGQKYRQKEQPLNFIHKRDKLDDPEPCSSQIYRKTEVENAIEDKRKASPALCANNDDTARFPFAFAARYFHSLLNGFTLEFTMWTSSPFDLDPAIATDNRAWKRTFHVENTGRRGTEHRSFPRRCFDNEFTGAPPVCTWLVPLL